MLEGLENAILDAKLSPVARERKRIIADLTEELLAIQEVGEDEVYCEGFRHAIEFLTGEPLAD